MPESTEEAMAAAPATPNPPVAFAFLRNAHEALRKVLFEKLMPTLQNGDKEGFKSEWKIFDHASRYHASMEDKYVFPLLDEFSEKKVSNEMIPAEHIQEEKLSNRIKEEIESNGIPSLEAFDAWREYYLNHLTHEEKVITPVTGTLGPTPGKRATVFYDRIINNLWKADKAEFLFFVGWMVKQLSTFGSTNNNASTAARVVVHGLQWSTNPTQWKEILPVVKENTTVEIWEEMVRDYHIESPAFQRDQRQPSHEPVKVVVNNTKNLTIIDSHEDSSLDFAACCVVS